MRTGPTLPPALLAAALLAACASPNWNGEALPAAEEPAAPGRTAPVARDVPALLPSVQASTFADSVQFVLQVTNTTESPIELSFGSGQSFDFVVRSPGGEEAWRWSADRMFTQAMRSETLPAGETLTYTAAWIPPRGTSGEFVVVGSLTARDARVQQEARFRLP